jgi:hypothetical protein
MFLQLSIQYSDKLEIWHPVSNETEVAFCTAQVAGEVVNVERGE